MSGLLGAPCAFHCESGVSSQLVLCLDRVRSCTRPVRVVHATTSAGEGTSLAWIEWHTPLCSEVESLAEGSRVFAR
eukprot:1631617-Pyramimonas_sp.AAC.1